MISILIPTREKLEPLKRTLTAIIENSSNSNNYEILIGVDNDDIKTVDFFKNMENENIRIFYFERQFYKNVHFYYNNLAKNAKGELLWIFADDFEISTKNWDLCLDKYKIMFNYIKVNNIQSDWDTLFSIIPIIPKKWFDLIERISDYSQVDGWCWAIARELNIAVYDSSIEVNNFVDANAYLHQNYYKNGYDGPAGTDELNSDVLKISNYLKTLK